ncbi:N-acetyltransferase aca1-like [Gigantopelta aegis]|uniref:N-acetyltransferase aca1-like n=1 Tax=Gigantopelta aegis TaxID=1735272 RepID=UPI001B888BFA|nr:N-acetyltransferase aca1-like [Gigantopelta aegis]
MAYVIAKKPTPKLSYLPKSGCLKTGRRVVLDYFRSSDETEVHEILVYVVNEEGDSYPYFDMSDIGDFRNYYLSHDVFVCRDATTHEVLAAFYVKPNFPGRSSHICNTGFIVKKIQRGTGIGSFLVPEFLQIARDLGYRASFFNLVYASNASSIALWRKFGFKEIGVVPQAGYFEGTGYIDALQFYYDLTTVPKTTPDK